VQCHQVGNSNVSWEGRQHFFFAAARAMCDILVEQARRKAGPQRGGGRSRLELDDACAVLEPPSDNVLAIHEALEELETRDPLKARIVLLRYFTGLTMDDRLPYRLDGLPIPEVVRVILALSRHWPSPRMAHGWSAAATSATASKGNCSSGT
jgi:hypothetical protein